MDRREGLLTAQITRVQLAENKKELERKFMHAYYGPHRARRAAAAASWPVRQLPTVCVCVDGVSPHTLSFPSRRELGDFYTRTNRSPMLLALLLLAVTAPAASDGGDEARARRAGSPPPIAVTASETGALKMSFRGAEYSIGTDISYPGSVGWNRLGGNSSSSQAGGPSRCCAVLLPQREIC